MLKNSSLHYLRKIFWCRWVFFAFCFFCNCLRIPDYYLLACLLPNERMKTKKKTIQDIAEELGISKSTVSRALRDSYEIGKETKMKVMALAEKWNFHINRQASCLKSKRSYLLGVVVPEIAHSFFASAISGIEEAALQNGYNLLICQSGELECREKQLVRQLINSSVDGIIISLSHDTKTFEHLQEAIDDDIPVVLFDRTTKKINCSKVVVSHTRAAITAVDHLVKNGCTRIAHLAGCENLHISQERMNGFKTALEKHHLPFKNEYILMNGYNSERTPGLVRQLMNLPEPPDGITCFNDDVAIHAMITLKELGYKVPEQVKVIGFNNEPSCTIVSPTLTSVDHPAFDMGKKAAELFLKHVDPHHEFHPRTVLFTTDIVERESTRG